MSAIAAADTEDTTGTADATQAAAPPESPKLSRFAARVTAGLLALSILLAAYTGFRVPNLWSVTLMSVSITDGFHRRFLAGTLLRPIAESRNFTYWFYAAVAFAIIVALLAVIAVAALRSQLLSQRFLVIAWLLLPTGGFLFNEVGYLDQLIYLFLFAALFVLKRSYWWLAPVLMTLAVLTHELSLLTVIPIFAFVALRVLPLRRAIVALAPAAVVGLVVLVIPASESGAVPGFERMLRGANWTPRADALDLFNRTQSESWDLYLLHEVIYYLIPFLIVSVVAFLLLYRADRANEPAPVLADWAQGMPWLYPVLAVAAIASPALLTFAGWDMWRWGFLLLSNFFIVVWIWLGERARELDTTQLVTLAAALLVTIHVSLLYFDVIEPRDISTNTFRELQEQIEDGSLFDIPSR